MDQVHYKSATELASLIRRKKIVMQNDYIPSMLDIYCA